MGSAENRYAPTDLLEPGPNQSGPKPVRARLDPGATKPPRLPRSPGFASPIILEATPFGGRR